MGAQYLHVCEECGHKIRTGGPWEFYRDAEGRLQHYGHPAPVSEEAEAAGVKGLYGKLYCPGCQEVHETVLVEYESPEDRFSIWDRQGREARTAVPGCPECDRAWPVLAVMPADVTCPECGRGRFRSSLEWVS